MFNKAINKFKVEFKNHKEGKKDIYRSTEVRNEEMKQKGRSCNNKEGWYKTMNNSSSQYTSVIRVPFTKGSSLKKVTEKLFKSMRNPHGTRTKVVENGGVKLKEQLMKVDPFPKDNCGKKECDMRDCGEKCYQGNVNYDLVCKMCESEGREKHVYMGESSRGCFSRGKQHREAYKSESGFMWEHDVRKHGGRKNVHRV